ncbi:MAG: energy-coupling factor transporter ATPase [Acholeplasmataceae bacterium]
MALFTIKDLTFKYPNGKAPVLNKLNLEIQEGAFITLFGKTGCGKTTLLKLLKKQLAPYGEISGQIWYKNTLIDNIDERTAVADIGFVMQNPDQQIITDKVWHELVFGLESLGVEQSEIQKRVAETASFFGITNWYHQTTDSLSGGQKQLLNLAAIMVMNPNILILDEPTAQLDPIAATEFLHILKRINQELGTTILIVEHRLEEVIPLSDYVIIMKDKKIVLQEAPQNLQQEMRKLELYDMLVSLPSSMQIFDKLNKKGTVPITVRDGINFLKEHYDNQVKSLGYEKTSKEDKTVLEIKEGFFRYERETPDILNGLSLEIYENEFFCIVGDNGVGKSTLLKIFSGLNKLYAGKIRLWNKEYSSYKKTELYRNQLAMLPQNPQTLFIKNTVLGELKDACSIMDYPRKTIDQAIESIVSFLRLDQLLEQHPYDLSGGEQQKVALAKVLLMKPKILFLDEPTKGMDAFAKTEFAHLIKTLKKQGVTIVMVSHDIEFAAQYADRVSMYFDGKIVSIGNRVDFFKNNYHYTTAAYRISRLHYSDATTVERVVELCQKNKEKNE